MDRKDESNVQVTQQSSKKSRLWSGAKLRQPGMT